jgi:PAS domain S-box-containing protein
MKGLFMRCGVRTSSNLMEFGHPDDPILVGAIGGEPRNLLETFSPHSSAANWIKDPVLNAASTALRPSQSSRDTRARQTIPFPLSFDTPTRLEDSDRALHQATTNFETIFHTSPAILSIIHLNSRRYRDVNDTYERCTGYSRSEVLGKPSIALGLWSNVHDRERAFQKLAIEGSLLDQQGTFQTKAGKPFTALFSARVIEFGSELCALVTAKDITVCRQVEEERLDLIQRLINAQEAERTRVARELHDNIGQSLALFCMDLEATRLALKLPADGDDRLKRLCGRINDLGHVVGNLSHHLHSAELEWLGLVAAVRGLCREFSEQYSVQVECVCTDIPDDLGADVSVGLFRVTQEALRNVTKHSQANRVAVEVRKTRNTLTLRISDDGIGFPTDKALRKQGLGLTSMRERILLIGGELTVTSKPRAGTRIEAVVPLQ